MHYHFKVHKEKGEYWAECIELGGCVTQGKNREELDQNMSEALNLCLEEPADSTHIAPLPRKNLKGRGVVAVGVDPEVAFGFMVRRNRLRERLTQSQAADKLGFKSVYSYQRLERRCNVRLAMMAKLKELFPKLSFDAIVS